MYNCCLFSLVKLVSFRSKCQCIDNKYCITKIFIFFSRNTNSSTTILWDECAIEESLRQFVCLAFDTSTDFLTFFDTFESGAILQTCNSLSQSQKDAALLWTSWKSLVIFIRFFKMCKQTADLVYYLHFIFISISDYLNGLTFIQWSSR